MAKANKHEPDDGQVDLNFDEYEETVVTVGGNESEEKEAKEEQKTEQKGAKKEEQKPKEAKLEEKSKQQAKENKQ